MDLENQRRVKEFAEQFGPENVVVVVGAAEGEAAGLAAETVENGDPTFAGPLTGVQLGLACYHVCEPEMKEEFDEDVYDAINLENCVMQRNSYGGPSPKAVTDQLEELRYELGQSILCFQ